MKFIKIVIIFSSIIAVDIVSAQMMQHESNEEYELRINTLLASSTDLLGEAMIASGGATYEKMQGYLRPLFYSAGRRVGADQGVHNILYADENGVRPFFVAIADGSRIAMNLYDNPNDITVQVGETGEEVFGADLQRLSGPFLNGGYYPILQTTYRSKEGVVYTQESFAAHVEGMRPLVAMVKITVKSDVGTCHKLVIRHGRTQEPKRVLCSVGEFQDSVYTRRLNLTPGEMQTLYYFWSPTADFTTNFVADKKSYDKAQSEWKSYWDRALNAGIQFKVPEKTVMDCQKNLLIQNLVLRHRYSLGNNAYDESLYHPESCDAATALAKFGYDNEARNALEVIYGASLGSYANWVMGEQLSHSAEYFYLTQDTDFISKWSARYKKFMADFEKQIKEDPHGLLTPQALSSDIATKEYYTYQQAVAWRGWRDMSQILRKFRFVKSDSTIVCAQKFRDSVLVAVRQSQTRLDDGSLFIPSILYGQKREIYNPISETVLGSYWNLCMPYAFNSGIFDYKSKDMDDVLKFMHNHGGILLGMLRFNFYATPIGSQTTGGIPGYYTTGVDNVYLLSYLRTLAQRGDTERMIVSFYGRLVHGQTRNTFSAGEGDNIGVYLGVEQRCSFGSWNSANNLTLLENLRYMLLSDSYDNFTGEPDALLFAQATPREWLQQGKTIEFTNAPTIFGKASCKIISNIDHGSLQVSMTIPIRNPIQHLSLTLRLPNGKKIESVQLNGKNHLHFNAESETIDLSGMTGEIAMTVKCK